ncbi:hypothetical protein D3C86_1608480 [compost metagenome]
MPRHDVEGGNAKRLGRLHIGQFADHQRRGAHDAGKARRVDDGKSNDDSRQRRSERCHQRNRQQNIRKSHHGVDQPGDRRIQFLEETGEQAERDADQRRKRHHRGPDQKRQSSSVDGAGEDVTAKLIGAEPVEFARRLQAIDDRQFRR